MFAMVKIFQGDAKKRANEWGLLCSGLWRRSGDLAKYSREALHSSVGGRVHCCQSTSLKLPQIRISFILLCFFSARREYLDVIRVELIAQPLAVDGEDGEVVRGVGGHHDPLPAQTERGGRRQLGSSLECPGK